MRSNNNNNDESSRPLSFLLQGSQCYPGLIHTEITLALLLHQRMVSSFFLPKARAASSRGSPGCLAAAIGRESLGQALGLGLAFLRPPHIHGNPPTPLWSRSEPSQAQPQPRRPQQARASARPQAGHEARRKKGDAESREGAAGPRDALGRALGFAGFAGSPAHVLRGLGLSSGRVGGSWQSHLSTPWSGQATSDGLGLHCAASCGSHVSFASCRLRRTRRIKSRDVRSALGMRQGPENMSPVVTQCSALDLVWIQAARIEIELLPQVTLKKSLTQGSSSSMAARLPWHGQVMYCLWSGASLRLYPCVERLDAHVIRVLGAAGSGNQMAQWWGVVVLVRAAIGSRGCVHARERSRGCIVVVES